MFLNKKTGPAMKKWFLLLFISIFLISGLIYIALQQDIRQSANDPQIQMAEDAARLLSKGQQIKLSDTKIDISESLAPFRMIFDANGKVVSSEAILDGRNPNLPSGVFDLVRQKGENRLTW